MRELEYPWIARPRTEHRVEIVMPNEETKWFSADVGDPRFSQDIAQLLNETHGSTAHLYALEKVLESEERGDGHAIDLWKGVLKLLDRGENHG